MHPKTDLIIGSAVIVLVFAATWAAVGFFLACFIWVFFAASSVVLHFLLSRNSKLAKVGAVAFQWNTVFLFFLPKRTQEQLRELRKRDANRPNQSINPDAPR